MPDTKMLTEDDLRNLIAWGEEKKEKGCWNWEGDLLLNKLEELLSLALG